MKNHRLSSVLVLAGLAGSVLPRPSAAEEVPRWMGLRVDEGRIERHILELARFGANPEGGVSRVAFSDADIEGRRYIAALMEEAGRSSAGSRSGGGSPWRRASWPAT